MNKLQKEILDWSNKTFNKGMFTRKRAIPISHHLQKESKELTEGLKEYFSQVQTPQSLDRVAEELADVFILAMETASHLGMSMDDVELACRRKFEICKDREWGEPDANGVVEHIKTQK